MWIGYHEQARQLVEAKGEFEWLAEVPGHCLQQTLIDLDQACARHSTWKVDWKSKVKNSPSFRFPEGGKILVERLNRRWARAKLPKLGWVRFRLTRPLGASVKNATVSRDGGHWYISFLVEDGLTPPERHADPGTAVGIDRGVVKVVTRSDGIFHHRVFARITVNPAYTSQRCSVCTVVDGKSRESQAVFRCTSCGHTEHADVNAAKNILTAGRAEHAHPRAGVRAGARKPRNRVGRKANRQATAAQATAQTEPEPAGIPRL
ncbi:transposase [Streptosporangium canum]|uniref:RNA-guided endonuclease InsQ/TnpB family protein n=1 Tax=Streptosporangium canum TaxID=324952 RepID=UPI0033B29A91